MTFDGAFDAAFSNAALHWMLDKERAARRDLSALKPGGRFAGEMGGEGNLAAAARGARRRAGDRAAIGAADRGRQLVSRRPRNSPPSMKPPASSDIDARLIERPTPLDAWRRRLGHDLPRRLARPRRRARSRARRDRRARSPTAFGYGNSRRLCPPPLHHEKACLMRYLPLSDADRSAMLGVIGAGSIDDLFRDVPEAARLDGRDRGPARPCAASWRSSGS